jgi:predicted XRE-type DNA-binding protein
MGKQSSDASQEMLSELITIKKLLVFQLLINGASQKQIAAALGVNQSQIRRMFPNGSSESPPKRGRV